MKIVYKYSLGGKPHDFEIEMQEGAEILTVQVQKGTACIWALVDSDAPLITRRLFIIGTGRDASILESVNAKYIGTFQLLNGDLIWHLFEEET